MLKLETETDSRSETEIEEDLCQDSLNMTNDPEELRQQLKALQSKYDGERERAAEADRLRIQAEARNTQAQQAQPGANYQRSSILKMDPPSLDDFSYQVWKKRLKVWLAGTGSVMTDKQRACAVMQTIGDDHKRHKLGLGTLILL